MTWRTSLFRSETLVKLATVAATGALLATACTITSGTDGDPGPSPTTGGTSGTGASGGTGGTDPGTGGEGGDTQTTGGADPGTGGTDPGTGGETMVDCHPGGVVSGTPYSTEPDDDDDCTGCAKEKCGEYFANCYAEGPDSVCGWGDATGAEGDCMFNCFGDLHDDGVFAGSQDDIDDCVFECGGHAACGTTEPSSVTIAFVSCMIGVTGDDPLACLNDCGLGIDEEEEE